MTALYICHQFPDKLHIVHRSILINAAPQEDIAQTVRLLLIDASFGNDRNKVTFLCNGGNTAQIKERLCRASTTVEHNDQRPFLIRSAALRHILVPSACHTVHFHGLLFRATSDRLFEIAQLLLARTSVTACKADITPCCFHLFLRKRIFTNGQTNLCALLLIDFAQNAHRSRHPDLICAFSGQRCTDNMVLLFPEVNSSGVVCVFCGHAHPDGELCSHTHDFQLYFTLIGLAAQSGMFCVQITVQVAERHQSAPLACHPACSLMCGKAAITDTAEIDVILHGDIKIACLNRNVNGVQIIGITAVRVPCSLRRCQMQEQLFVLRESFQTGSFQILFRLLTGRDRSDQTGLAVIQIFRNIGQKFARLSADLCSLLKETGNQRALGIGKVDRKVSHLFRESFDIHL